jgi:hypothetical protein
MVEPSSSDSNLVRVLEGSRHQPSRRFGSRMVVVLLVSALAPAALTLGLSGDPQHTEVSAPRPTVTPVLHMADVVRARGTSTTTAPATTTVPSTIVPTKAAPAPTPVPVNAATTASSGVPVVAPAVPATPATAGPSVAALVAQVEAAGLDLGPIGPGARGTRRRNVV